MVESFIIIIITTSVATSASKGLLSGSTVMLPVVVSMLTPGRWPLLASRMR